MIPYFDLSKFFSIYFYSFCVKSELYIAKYKLSISKYLFFNNISINMNTYSELYFEFVYINK